MLILYLIACILLFSVLYYMPISVLMEFQVHSKKKRVYGGFYVLIYEARTRRRAKDTATRATGCVPPCHATWFLVSFSRLELYRPIWPIQAEIPKKTKKKVRNAPFKPNIKPYFQLTSHKHIKQVLCLSLTPSLVSHSLCALC